MPDNLQHGEIVFNGTSSRTFGLVVEQIPIYSKPLQKVHTYEIPGRNGSFVEKEQTWENVEVSYNVWFSDLEYEKQNPQTFTRRLTDIMTWLYAPSHERKYANDEIINTDYGSLYIVAAGTGDYCTLIDNFNPTIYRLAYFAGPVDFERQLIDVGKATITFNCMPQRFRAVGNEWLVKDLGTGQAGSLQSSLTFENLNAHYGCQPELAVLLNIQSLADTSKWNFIFEYFKDPENNPMFERATEVQIELPGEAVHGIPDMDYYPVLNISSQLQQCILKVSKYPNVIFENGDIPEYNFSKYVKFYDIEVVEVAPQSYQQRKTLSYNFPAAPPSTDKIIVNLQSTENVNDCITGFKTHTWTL